MQWRDGLTVTGRLTIVTYDGPSRRLVNVERCRNLVMVGGKTLALRLLLGQTATYLLAMAAGDNNTPPALTDAALFSERVRGPLTSVSISDNGTKGIAVVRFVLGTTQGNGFTFREAGLFNSVVAGQGEIYARVAHADKVKTEQKVLLYQWQLECQ